MKITLGPQFDEVLKNASKVAAPFEGRLEGAGLTLKAAQTKGDSSVAGDGSAAAVESFADLLKKAVEDLNQSQVKADKVVEGFLAGDIQDVHQVMIAMEEARLTMQLAVEVRNKIVEAYQEISRMQI